MRGGAWGLELAAFLVVTTGELAASKWMMEGRVSLIFLSALFLGAGGCHLAASAKKPAKIDPTQARIISLIRQTPDWMWSEDLTQEELDQAERIAEELRDVPTAELRRAMVAMAENHLPGCPPETLGFKWTGDVYCRADNTGHSPAWDQLEPSDQLALDDLGGIIILNRFLFEIEPEARTPHEPSSYGPEGIYESGVYLMASQNALWPLQENEVGELEMHPDLFIDCPTGEPPYQPIWEFDRFAERFPRRD